MTTPIPGTPTPPIGNITDEQAFTLKMASLDAQIKAAQKRVAAADAKIKKLSGKKDSKSKALLAAANAQKKAAQTQLEWASSARGKVQNDWFQKSGQYDKLLQGANRDAFMALNTLFTQYGLGSLAGKIYEYVKNGYGADTISILLQDTPEYKKRFAANQARINAGMSVLSPAEYISIENSYRQIMRQSGLPEGFYDSNEDFTNWISGDVSPTELQTRVDLATQATALANPSYKAALKQMGLSDGDIAAYFLDKDRAVPYLQKAAATAAIGSEALQRGLQFDQAYSEQLATTGISREQAAQGYAKIADEYTDLQTLAQVYGGQWTQRQAEEDTFIGGTAASQQKQGLISKEKGTFSGATGGARSGLAQRGGAR